MDEKLDIVTGCIICIVGFLVFPSVVVFHDTAQIDNLFYLACICSLFDGAFSGVE